MENQLLSQFQYRNTEQNTTPGIEPETTDLTHLEQSLTEVLTTRRLLNKALFTFVCVFACSAGVSVLTSVGVSAIATTSLAGVVFAISLGNILSKVSYDGSLNFDQDFIIACFHSIGTGSSLWLALGEVRQVSNSTTAGKEQFYQEVRQYEVKPPSTLPTGSFLVVLGLGVLVVFALLRQGRR